MGLEIKFTERELHPIMYIIVPLGAFSLAFLCGGILMSWASVNPISGYEAFISGAIGSPVKFADTLVRTTSFLLMGVGLAFALRARVFNIGAEGQYIMGAIVGTWVALLLQENLPPSITIIVSLIMAMVIGGLWAGFAGYLKATLGINEVVLTVIMNWLAFKLLQWLLRGPLKNPLSEMWPMSPPIQAKIPVIISGTRLHLGFILAVLIAIGGYFLMFKTNYGFKLRVAGMNPDAAKYAGYDVRKIIISSMILSGSLAGLAGAIEVLAVYHFLYEGISIGLGYTSIIVALVGKLHPLAIIPSALMFGALYNGVVYLQSALGVSYTLSKAMEGMIYLFVLISEVFLKYKVRIIRR